MADAAVDKAKFQVYSVWYICIATNLFHVYTVFSFRIDQLISIAQLFLFVQFISWRSISYIFDVKSATYCNSREQ